MLVTNGKIFLFWNCSVQAAIILLHWATMLPDRLQLLLYKCFLAENTWVFFRFSYISWGLMDQGNAVCKDLIPKGQHIPDSRCFHLMWFYSASCRLSAHESDLLGLSINEQTNDQWQIYPLIIILRKYREYFYYFWSNPTITQAFWFTVLAMDPCFQVIVKDSQRIFPFVAGQSSCSWWRIIKTTSLISDALRTNCGRGKNRLETTTSWLCYSASFDMYWIGWYWPAGYFCIFNML